MKIIDAVLGYFKPKVDKNPQVKVIRLDEIDSTNNYFKNYNNVDNERLSVVITENQTAGRGQGQNKWESEKGKNLTFSLLVHPTMVPVRNQFLLSETGALALKEVLTDYVQDDIKLKWPNDIYWKDKKLSGTLIETTLSAGHIKDCIIGVGLNINQASFKSDAPNPVSLFNILGHEIDKEEVLQKIIQKFSELYQLLEMGGYNDISAMYHEALYRRGGFHLYRDAESEFEGAIVEVEDDGHLILRDKNGLIRSYAFKEVEFVL